MANPRLGTSAPNSSADDLLGLIKFDATLDLTAGRVQQRMWNGMLREDTLFYFTRWSVGQRGVSVTERNRIHDLAVSTSTVYLSNEASTGTIEVRFVGDIEESRRFFGSVYLYDLSYVLESVNQQFKA